MNKRELKKKLKKEFSYLEKKFGCSADQYIRDIIKIKEKEEKDELQKSKRLSKSSN